MICFIDNPQYDNQSDANSRIQFSGRYMSDHVHSIILQNGISSLLKEQGGTIYI